MHTHTKVTAPAPRVEHHRTQIEHVQLGDQWRPYACYWANDLEVGPGWYPVESLAQDRYSLDYLVGVAGQVAVVPFTAAVHVTRPLGG